MAVAVADVPVAYSLSGSPVFSFGEDSEWELEDREDSTNRLTITTSIEKSVTVTVDMEVVFRRSRYRVAETEQDRESSTVRIICDEMQAELSEIDVLKYAIKNLSLSAALARALQGTMWTVGSVHDNVSHQYTAEFENVNVSDLLQFLQVQSGQPLQFDSYNRKVSFVDPKPPPIDRVLTYGTGVSNLTKTQIAPQYTVIYPTGYRGMTISPVNGGVKYLEDFSWYTDQGVPLSEARRRFTRVLRWQDERYTVVGSLKTAAAAKLAEASRPVTTYQLEVERGLSDQYRLGDRAWIVDETMGVKLDARVVRILRTGSAGQDIVEFSYLPRSNASSNIDGSVSGTDNNGPVNFQIKNDSPLALSSAGDSLVLDFDVIVIAPTAFQVGLAVRLQTSSPCEVSGYFLLEGERLSPEIRQTVQAGWQTFALSFLVAGVEEGTKTLRLYMSVSSGTASIGERHAEMFVTTWGAIGGTSNERPDQKVLDFVGLWFPDFHWSDPKDLPPTVSLMAPIGASPIDQVGEWFDFSHAGPEDARRIETFYSSIVSGYDVLFWGMQPLQDFEIQVYDLDQFLVGGGAYQADANGEYEIDILSEYNLTPGDYTVEVVRNPHANTHAPQAPPPDTMDAPDVDVYVVRFHGMNARQSFEVTLYDDAMVQVGHGSWAADSLGQRTVDFREEFSLSQGIYHGKIVGFTPDLDFDIIGISMAAPIVYGYEVIFIGMVPGQEFEVVVFDQDLNEVGRETFVAYDDGEFHVDLLDRFGLIEGDEYDGEVTGWPIADFHIGPAAMSVPSGPVDSEYWNHNGVASYGGGEVVLINNTTSTSSTAISKETFPYTGQAMKLEFEGWVQGSADQLFMGIVDPSLSLHPGPLHEVSFWGCQVDIYNNRVGALADTQSKTTNRSTTKSAYVTWTIEFSEVSSGKIDITMTGDGGSWTWTGMDAPEFYEFRFAAGARTGGVSGTFKVRGTPKQIG